MVLLLVPTGIRIAHLSVSSGQRGEPLPRELDELEEVASHVLTVLREGHADRMLVGEAERQLLDDERLFEELVSESPDPRALAEAVEAARGAEDPVGYRLDDVGILLRGPEGEWYGAELDFDHRSGGVVVLENGPLVTLRALHPD